MTIDDFFVAEHAISEGSISLENLWECDIYEQLVASKHARHWMVEIAEKVAMRNCDCEDCKAIPEGPDKVRMNTAAAISLGFVLGVRCGRLLPEKE